ncbi:UNVERIFIED_CONTAM: Serine/threonine-protein phosphatase 6 regulatory subunit [Sesamum angustifolium]|uniref:Serine/threonine-protein phosphatase 6 regulatory subunit n=1 Tax=Sesamum angustifolium TaxID=2727405 RepID=A0AAW2KU18_9LAMI
MGLSTVSPVDTILDKEHFTLEELLDEDEIIQEVKALNGRLIVFNYVLPFHNLYLAESGSNLQEKSQVNQLVQYIVEEAPEDAKKPRIFKFPFVACEIFTCELMDLLFSFLDPGRPHSTLLAGYFSKVVVCLLLRKTAPLMNYIRAHQDIINKLVDLIGITSIMEDCPEVHANAAETLCTISRYAPQGLASKISSPSFIGRLFRHAFEDFRPKSVLVNLLSVCISLLDPKRLTSGVYYMYNRQMSQGAGITANPETVEGMLESLGDLLKLLDLSSEDHVLLTTYGKLQPPLGKHRLKIIEFISVLVAVSSEVAERELIRLGAVKRILELFFQYPYNNFLHHHVENVVYSCLGSKNAQFIEHLLCECNLIGKILEADKKFSLAVDASKPTVPAEGKSPPRIGNIGHLTRMANKLIHMGNSNSEIQTFLEQNGDWADWQKNVLLKRNALENVFQWACGRPTTLLDRMRDSDDDEYQDRDYDVAALANNLSQAFQYGICTNDVIDEGHGSAERDDEVCIFTASRLFNHGFLVIMTWLLMVMASEWPSKVTTMDVYFDDASAEVVISSLRLGHEQESGSLFTNSDWFAFEDQRIDSSIASPSPKGHVGADGGADDVIFEKDKDLVDSTIFNPLELSPTLDGNNVTSKLSEDMREITIIGLNKPPEWVEWRESSDSIELPPPLSSLETSNSAQCPSIPNGEPMELGVQLDDVELDKAESLANVHCKTDGGGSPDLNNVDSSPKPIQSAQVGDLNRRILEVDSHVVIEDSSGSAKCKNKN